MFKKLLILVITGGLLAGGQAIAQSETGTPSDIDQIIVVGARIPLTINQIGNSTTVITREILYASG